MVGCVAICIVVGVVSFVPGSEAGFDSEKELEPRFFISSGSAVSVNSSVITWVSAIVGAIILGSLLYIAYASVAGAAPPGGYGNNYRYKRGTHYTQCEFSSSFSAYYFVYMLFF
jgi:hypothetical protein